MKGSIRNREGFLNNISARLGRKETPRAIERPEWSYNPQDAILKEANADELLEVLKTQCTTIHTNLAVTNTKGLEETVRETVSEFGGGPVIAWRDERFSHFGLTRLFKEKWPEEYIEFHEWAHEDERLNIERADKANVGITISDITLAESGTAVLFSSRDKGRTVSFLPAASIILMPKSTIVPRMTQAARMIRDRMKNGNLPPSCINFITGPSNSADIEMNLVVGVHGPVKAAYIVIEDL